MTAAPVIPAPTNSRRVKLPPRPGARRLCPGTRSSASHPSAISPLTRPPPATTIPLQPSPGGAPLPVLSGDEDRSLSGDEGLCSSEHRTCPGSDRRIPVSFEPSPGYKLLTAEEPDPRPGPGSSSIVHPPSSTRVPAPLLIDPGPRGFASGSINQNTETHERKTEITPKDNRTATRIRHRSQGSIKT